MARAFDYLSDLHLNPVVPSWYIRPPWWEALALIGCTYFTYIFYAILYCCSDLSNFSVPFLPTSIFFSTAMPFCGNLLVNEDHDGILPFHLVCLGLPCGKAEKAFAICLMLVSVHTSMVPRPSFLRPYLPFTIWIPWSSSSSDRDGSTWTAK